MSRTRAFADAAPTQIVDLHDRAVVRVWSETEPNVAGLLGISRDLAYKMARSGELPTVQLGRRYVVPVPKLLALLGEPSSAS